MNIDVLGGNIDAQFGFEERNEASFFPSGLAHRSSRKFCGRHGLMMKLNFQVLGQGEPMLILHGLLGSLDNWKPYARAVADQFQVFLLDLRNHGRSPHASECNYDVMAEDIAEFINDHHLSAAHVLGHSMGGKVALRLAQLHPRQLLKLIVADMGRRENPPRQKEILEAMRALDLSRLQQRTEAEAALAAVAPDKALRQFLTKNIGRNDTGIMYWKCNLESLWTNYQHLLEAIPAEPQFAGPVLFIRGGRSDYIRDEDIPALRETFPRAEIETIPEAGHWLHVDAPAEFLRRTLKFLNED